MGNLGTQVKVTVLSGPVAAGQTTIQTAGVDMQGFESVMFIVFYGAITAGGFAAARIASSSDNGVSDAFALVTGSNAAMGDETYSDKVAVAELTNPRERYLRVHALRSVEDSVINSIIAIQFGARSLPTTHDASVGAYSLVVGG